MSQCQCSKKSGQQCKLKVSKKDADNKQFCHVHQGCVVAPKIESNIAVEKKVVRTPKEIAILDWLAETILEVVMTPAGGLYTVNFEDEQPTHNFTTFTEYEDWALEEIVKVENSGMDPENEDYSWQYYTLFSTLCPMFSSSKDDGGYAFDKGMQLQSIIQDT